jgi:outer membrane protein OmpA-like peptidoglycan-associated protein
MNQTLSENRAAAVKKFNWKRYKSG